MSKMSIALHAQYNTLIVAIIVFNFLLCSLMHLQRTQWRLQWCFLALCLLFQVLRLLGVCMLCVCVSVYFKPLLCLKFEWWDHMGAIPFGGLVLEFMSQYLHCFYI